VVVVVVMVVVVVVVVRVTARGEAHLSMQADRHAGQELLSERENTHEVEGKHTYHMQAWQDKHTYHTVQVNTLAVQQGAQAAAHATGVLTIDRRWMEGR
jgi:hypothetical protein